MQPFFNALWSCGYGLVSERLVSIRHLGLRQPSEWWGVPAVDASTWWTTELVVVIA